jgi:hypothetical protein
MRTRRGAAAGTGMLAARLLAVVLVVALTGLAPLALASPPDPIWMGGLFDGGDSDDAVVAAAASEGVSDGMAAGAGEGVLTVVGTVRPPASIGRASSPAPVSRGRAPPPLA